MNEDIVKGLSMQLDGISVRLSAVEKSLSDVASALVSIARIEERMTSNNSALQRAFAAIEDVNKRLDESQSAIALMNQRIQKGGYCDWAIQKQEEEKNTDTAKRDIVVHVLKNILWLVIAMAIGAFGIKSLGV